MGKPRILAFSGSARKASFNQRLVTAAARFAEEAGAEVHVINLGDYPMPIMDLDHEAEHGLPEHALRLKTVFADYDGLLVASPEYNGSVAPLLKNTLDWVSRRGADPTPMRAYRGKTAALLSASPGRLGGLRGLVDIRSILTDLGVLVLPEQVAIASAGSAFHDDGQLVDENNVRRVKAIATRLVDVVARLT